MLKPSRRSWSDRDSGRRERDLARTARWTKAFAWAAFPALFIGGFLTVSFGWPGVVAGLGILLGAGGFATFMSEAAGAASRGMLEPGIGRSVAPSSSRAEALEARGEFREAAVAWEVSVLERPDHPEPALRLARLHRDHLGDLDAAMRWFRRAIEIAGTTGDVRVVMREFVEAARKAEPSGRGAATLLARYRDAQGEETPEGEWATRELAAIKAAMREADR